ncbi:hypothetical protein MTP06_36050 [Streptomyces sp. PLM4]|nr:hypothetical protein MTP06_36050 [Streptomyces sp. PLM4]
MPHPSNSSLSDRAAAHRGLVTVHPFESLTAAFLAIHVFDSSAKQVRRAPDGDQAGPSHPTPGAPCRGVPAIAPRPAPPNRSFRPGAVRTGECAPAPRGCPPRVRFS